MGLGQAGGGIFFIVDALDTKAKGYDVVISFPKEGIGTAAEGIALLKGAKNPAAGKKLIDWATSPGDAEPVRQAQDQFRAGASRGGDRSRARRGAEGREDLRHRRRLCGREPQEASSIAGSPEILSLSA